MQEKELTKKLKGKFTKDNFLILVLVGVLLLVIAWPVEKKEESRVKSVQLDNESDMMNICSVNTQNTGNVQSAGMNEYVLLAYASALEYSLEELLGTMAGVGEVKVMVTLESSGEALVEKDINTIRNGSTEVDSAGGSRNTTDISENMETVRMGGQGNDDMPYVKKVIAPRIQGVVVSAQGGGNAKTVKNITEAIQALFGIDAHKIKIVKMISQ